LKTLLITVLCIILISACSEKGPNIIKNKEGANSKPDDSAGVVDTSTFYDNTTKIHARSDIAGKDNIIAIMYELILKLQSKEFAAEFAFRGKNTNDLLDSVTSEIILKNGFESVGQYESAFSDCVKAPDFKSQTDSLKAIIYSCIYKLKYSKNQLRQP
jgi:hypothetical protein